MTKTMARKRKTMKVKFIYKLVYNLHDFMVSRRKTHGT